MERTRPKTRMLPALLLLALVAAPDTTTVVEREPNNTMANATQVAVGERALGLINPAGDLDIWSVDLVAGQFVGFDVDAFEPDHRLDATLELFAPDGTTSLAFNDDFDGLDPRISFHVPVSGRYFVVVRAFGGTGGPTEDYALNVGTVGCGAVGTEREPNGTAAGATPAVLGGDGSGEICAADANPAGDVDFWAFTADAGTTIELDVDAASLGPFVDPIVSLYGSDGVTRLAFNDDANGADSQLQFTVPATGVYYATVASADDPGGNPFPYTLHFRVVAGGPGDPIAVRAENLGRPVGLAVGSTGDLFAADLTGGRILRISGQGGVTTFATGIPTPTALAFDAFGNLLVISLQGTVYRVTPQGQASLFPMDAGDPVWVAVGPDGRIWLSDLFDRSVRRYSPTGQLEARFDAIGIGQAGPGPLAIGPSGAPYFSNGTEIWTLADGQPRRIARAGFTIRGFAFDEAGNIYAASAVAGRVVRFAPDGSTLDDPFAVSPDAPEAVAFGRDPGGATNARLFATDENDGQVIELNPAGAGRRGLPVGFRAPAFSRDAAVARLLGGAGLSAEDLQLLDQLGNHNGRYDVGDFRAYLITQGAVPGAAPSQGSRP